MHMFLGCVLFCIYIFFRKIYTLYLNIPAFFALFIHIFFIMKTCNPVFPIYKLYLWFSDIKMGELGFSIKFWKLESIGQDFKVKTQDPYNLQVFQINCVSVLGQQTKDINYVCTEYSCTNEAWRDSRHLERLKSSKIKVKQVQETWRRGAKLVWGDGSRMRECEWQCWVGKKKKNLFVGQRHSYLRISRPTSWRLVKTRVRKVWVIASSLKG